MKFRDQIKKISDNNQNSLPIWQDQDGRKSDTSIYAKVALINFTDRRLYHSLATLSRGKVVKTEHKKNRLGKKEIEIGGVFGDVPLKIIYNNKNTVCKDICK